MAAYQERFAGRRPAGTGPRRVVLLSSAAGLKLLATAGGSAVALGAVATVLFATSLGPGTSPQTLPVGSGSATTSAGTATGTATSTSEGKGPDAKGPAAHGLCNAWSNHLAHGTAEEKAKESTAFRNLAAAAGGPSKVAQYCATVTSPGTARGPASRTRPRPPSRTRRRSPTRPGSLTRPQSRTRPRSRARPRRRARARRPSPRRPRSPPRRPRPRPPRPPRPHDPTRPGPPARRARRDGHHHGPRAAVPHRRRRPRRGPRPRPRPAPDVAERLGRRRPRRRQRARRRPDQHRRRHHPGQGLQRDGTSARPTRTGRPARTRTGPAASSPRRCPASRSTA